LLRRVVASVWFRVAVVVGLLALIASRVDWTRAMDRLEKGNFESFVVAVALLASALLVGGIRWWVSCVVTAVSPRLRWPASTPGAFSLTASCPRHSEAMWRVHGCLREARGCRCLGLQRACWLIGCSVSPASSFSAGFSCSHRFVQFAHRS
jgi:hypothetical protein